MRTLLMAIVAVVGLSGTAVAGNKFYQGGTSVVIGNGYFEGAYGHTRGSSNPNEIIACLMSAQPNSTYYYCYAVDASNNFKMCQLNGSTTMATALASITPFSFLYVTFDNNGYCTMVNVTNSSAYAPMTP